MIISLSLFGSVGCSEQNENDNVTEAKNSYEQITPQEAKKLMETEAK